MQIIAVYAVNYVRLDNVDDMVAIQVSLVSLLTAVFTYTSAVILLPAYVLAVLFVRQRFCSTSTQHTMRQHASAALSRTWAMFGVKYAAHAQQCK